MYVSRAKLIRHSRARHGEFVSATDDRGHIARRSYSYCDVKKSILRGVIDVVERTVTTAHGEGEVVKARSWDSQDSALVAAANGFRGGDTQNGRSSGESKRQQQQ